MRLGFHISVAGGLVQSLKKAVDLDCGTMQIFNGSPRTWSTLSFSSNDIQEFKEKRRKLDISPLIVHTPYLINLASPVKKDWEKSKDYFIREIEFAQAIQADYLVTHLGNHKGKGLAFGENRVSKALGFFLKKVKSDSLKILLENTAGQGTSIGYNLEQINRLINNVENPKKIGFCLDTAHAFAAGYKINTAKGWKNFVSQMKKLELTGKMELVHLNDSKSKLGSKVDRHQHIGKGEIGKGGFKIMLTSTLLRRKSIIMETPRESIDDDLENLDMVNKLSK